MPPRITITSPTLPRIEVTSPRLPRIEPEVVAAALGAEPVGEKRPGHPGPLTLYAMRAEMMRRRVSQGGRPRIEGTDQRVKVPISDQDWQALESLASSLASKGFTPSAGQVASVLLNMAIRSVQSSSEGPALVDRITQQLDAPAAVG